MNLLAIDTSTEIASVALLAGDELTFKEQGSQRTHAQFLLPMIDKILVESGLMMSQLDGVVFGAGPGSFTGLRIACSIAKGIAYAHDLGVIPVSSLASIAFAVRQQEGSEMLPVLAVLDARMSELYWGYFKSNEAFAPEKVGPAQAIEVPDAQSFIVAGVGLAEYGALLSESVQLKALKSMTLYPHAKTMLQLARTQQISVIPAQDAAPVYIRNQVTQGGSRG